MPAPLHALAQSCCDYGLADSNRLPTSAVVILRFGSRRTRIEIDPETFDSLSRRGPDAPTDDAILEALAELDAGETMTGPELAKASGYAFAGWFQDRLAKLKRAGKIKTHGKKGYSLPIGDL